VKGFVPFLRGQKKKPLLKVWSHKNMKLTILLAIFSLLFPLSVINGQSAGTDEVIQRLKEVRERTKDLSADLLQEKTISLLKQKMVSRGQIRYKFPDRFSIEFFQPDTSLILFDGKTFLTYLKEEKVAERYHVHSNPTVEKYLLFSQDPFQEKWAQWRIIEDQESFLVMEILPKGEDFLFAKARFWISKKDWMVTGMEIVEKNGDTTLLQYSNIQSNTGLTDSDFKVLLPGDVRVTDVQ
jgi:outer membrane lipoprotein carrier protein